MAIPSRYRMSAERLEALKEELTYLETVREKEVAEQIKEARSFGDLSENSEYDEAKAEQGKLYSKIAEKEARSFGDLSENSEYDEAKAEQGKLYSKIAELKDLIENVELVDNVEEDLPKDSVTLGSVVDVIDLEDNMEETFEVVGSQEANPREGRISDDSPLGKGLHGHRAGDVVTIEAPAGMLQFKIVSVTNK